MSEKILKIDSIIEKTTILCEELLKNQGIKDLIEKQNILENNTYEMSKYEKLIKMEDYLTEKEENNENVSDQEHDDYINYLEQLSKIPVINDFFEAQEKLHHIIHIVNDFISITLEKNKVPTIEEVNEYCNHEEK